MPDHNVRRKLKYEAPILVPLGEMTEASGACVPGSGDSGDCTGGDSQTMLARPALLISGRLARQVVMQTLLALEALNLLLVALANGK
jgi:hypothetical protein